VAVDADGRQYRGFQDPASAEFDPTGLRAGADIPRLDRSCTSLLNSADGSVKGSSPAESRLDVRSEVGAGEGLDDARQVREGDAAIGTTSPSIW